MSSLTVLQNRQVSLRYQWSLGFGKVDFWQESCVSGFVWFLHEISLEPKHWAMFSIGQFLCVRKIVSEAKQWCKHNWICKLLCNQLKPKYAESQLSNFVLGIPRYCIRRLLLTEFMLTAKEILLSEYKMIAMVKEPRRIIFLWHIVPLHLESIHYHIASWAPLFYIANV